ncbi:hypothetical protein SACIG1750_2174 [Staphylococcus aureus subsp. aureus CIG1750]|nr:hypothetical protein SACIG1750_2174 [Staphylococcus aureus subsp. aureus CIG1750]
MCSTMKYGLKEMRLNHLHLLRRQTTINIPKMKFPKKYTEIIKKYKNKTPEEKAKIENDFIKDINDKDSEFYSPMMANMNEHELRAMLRMMPSLIDTGDDNDD